MREGVGYPSSDKDSLIIKYHVSFKDIFSTVYPAERVYASEGGNPPADDAAMCSTFCQYKGSPKMRTLRRQGKHILFML